MDKSKSSLLIRLYRYKIFANVSLWRLFVSALIIATYVASFTGCTNGSSGSGANDDTPPTGPYVQVPFGPNGTTLNTYLKTADPASDGVYYIEVMNLTKEDLTRYRRFIF